MCRIITNHIFWQTLQTKSVRYLLARKKILADWNKKHVDLTLFKTLMWTKILPSTQTGKIILQILFSNFLIYIIVEILARELSPPNIYFAEQLDRAVPLTLFFLTKRRTLHDPFGEIPVRWLFCSSYNFRLCFQFARTFGVILC